MSISTGNVDLMFFFSELLPFLTPLKPLNRISRNFVGVKDITCRCAYPQEMLIHFFSRSYTLYVLRNFAKMKDTTETAGQSNSSETAQQNFVKLCSYEGLNV